MAEAEAQRADDLRQLQHCRAAGLAGPADVGGPDFSKNVLPYVQKGAPIAHSTPSEGSFAGVNTMTIVKGCPEPELAPGVHHFVLSTQVQKGLAGIYGRGALGERRRPGCEDRGNSRVP